MHIYLSPQSKLMVTGDTVIHVVTDSTTHIDLKYDVNFVLRGGGGILI